MVRLCTITKMIKYQAFFTWFLMMHVIWCICSCGVSIGNMYVKRFGYCSDNKTLIYMQVGLFCIGIANTMFTLVWLLFVINHVTFCSSEASFVPRIPTPTYENTNDNLDKAASMKKRFSKVRNKQATSIETTPTPPKY